MFTRNMLLGGVSAVAVIALMGWAVVENSNSGTPSKNARSISNEVSQSQSVANAKNDVHELKMEIDALVGYSGYDNLASGSKDTWSQFDQNVGLKNLPESIKNDLPKNGMDPSDVSKIKTDCDNLEALWNIASINRNQTGADALRYTIACARTSIITSRTLARNTVYRTFRVVIRPQSNSLTNTSKESDV